MPNQFFQKIHYEAFALKKQDDETYDRERLEVADKLLELDKLLWPDILKHGWLINHHNIKEFWTSLWRVSQSRSNKLDAIWLHYGKSETELNLYKPFHSEANPQTFIHHIRFQVVVRHKEFEIGLILGKSDSGKWDRENYKILMQNPKTREDIYRMVSSLDDEYWLDFNSSVFPLSSFKNSDELWKYTKIDRASDYFTFGKSISPDDKRISKDNIKKTVIDEFEKLYPLYNIIKHRF